MSASYLALPEKTDLWRQQLNPEISNTLEVNIGNLHKLSTAIDKIHNRINWTSADTKLALQRIRQNPRFANFATLRDDPSNKIIGYSVFKKDPKDSSAAYISFIAVDPAHQQRGIGTNLMISTMIKIHEFGFTKIKLDYESSNEQAHRFYEKIARLTHVGYEVIETGRAYFESTEMQLTYDLTIDFTSSDEESYLSRG